MIDNKTIAYKGDYEKSYLMATNLLSLGLPVLFERVFNPDNIDDRTVKTSVSGSAPNTNGYTVKATFPGEYGTKIKFKVGI